MKRLNKPTRFRALAFLQSLITGITGRRRVPDKLKLRIQILDNSPDAISLQRLDGHCVYVNNAACTLYGYTREELIRMDLRQIIDPAHVASMEQQFSKLGRSGTAIIETVVLRKDGSVIPVEVHGRIIESGGEQFLFSVAHDITERKQTETKLRDAEARYRALFEQSPDGVMITDPETTEEIEFNDAACKLLGYSREEFTGMKITDFEAMETPELTKKHIAEIQHVGHAEFATKHRTKQGEIKDILVVAKPIDISGKSFHLSIHHDITERKRMEDELNLRALLLDNASDSIFLHDFDGNLTFVNETACKSLGYTREELMSTNLHQLDTLEYANLFESRMQELLKKGSLTFETVHFRKDGALITTEVHDRIIEFSGRKLILGVVRDITERKQLMEKLEHSSHLNKLILDSAGEGILGLDIQGNHTFINLAATKMLGYEVDELMYKHSHSTWHYKKPDGSPYSKEECPIYNALKNGATHRIDNEVFWKKDGTNFPVEYTSTPIREEGKVVGTVVVFDDVTERKKLEETIRQLAHYDPLTGLPNRNLFDDRITLALAHAARYDNRLALMMMDMDRFKEINDILGHDAGDKLLKDVSIRLVSVVRKTDTVSRMGGDEFVLLLSEVTSEEDVISIAQKLLEAVKKPFWYDEHELIVTASIGIAFYPNDGKDANTLIKHADVAMYRVKDKGRNGYLRYNPKMNGKSPK